MMVDTASFELYSIEELENLVDEIENVLEVKYSKEQQADWNKLIDSIAAYCGKHGGMDVRELICFETEGYLWLS